LGTACVKRADVDSRFHFATVDADGAGEQGRERVPLELLTRLEYLSLLARMVACPSIAQRRSAI
jgi:hypothetical protein